jgi:hypothetical protein
MVRQRPRGTSLALTTALLIAGISADDAPSGHALEKVVQMLGSMNLKAKQEKNEEEVAFSKFKTWCSEETAKLKNDITEDTQDVEVLAAKIGELKSEIGEHGNTIQTLETNVQGFEADRQAATEQRKKDRAEFLAESKDYAESVDALDRALITLKKQNYDRPAASFLQALDRDDVPRKAQTLVAAFMGLQQKNEKKGIDYEAPEANSYEFQSGNILTVLENLKDQFREKLAQCEKEETNSLHAYAMIEQDLSDSIANAKNEIAQNSNQKATKEGRAADAGKQLTQTKQSKSSSEATLAEMKQQCLEQKLSYEEKQQLRGEEIQAIERAIEILSSSAARGAAEKHFSLIQQKTATLALVQQSEKRGSRTTGVRRQLRSFLNSESVRLHSKNLALLVERIEADPFVKVKKMIDDMITRLLEEANQDTLHEQFCDTELGKSKITRNKLTEDIDTLSAAVDAGKAGIILRGTRIADLSAEVAELERILSEAADARTAEKADNARTIQEAKEAQTAVLAATNVLKDFYAKALTTTAFIQRSSETRGVPMGSDLWKSLGDPAYEGTGGGYAVGIASDKVDKGHRQGMQTFGDAYQGQQGAAGGVLALMEVILSDFAALEADTSAAEASSAQSHVKFTRVTMQDTATKRKQIEMDTADKTRFEQRLREDTADLKSTQDQLLAANRYYDKLVPQCIDPGMTFEERTQARAAEIASLKEALRILSKDDIETSA